VNVRTTDDRHDLPHPNQVDGIRAVAPGPASGVVPALGTTCFRLSQAATLFICHVRAEGGLVGDETATATGRIKSRPDRPDSPVGNQ
jgi:hypothetical protein